MNRVNESIDGTLIRDILQLAAEKLRFAAEDELDAAFEQLEKAFRI